MILEDLFFTMVSGVAIPVISVLVLFSFLPFKLKLRVLEKISPFWEIRFPWYEAEFFTDFIPFWLAWFVFLYYWVILLGDTTSALLGGAHLWGLLQILYEIIRPRLIPEEPLPLLEGAETCTNEKSMLNGDSCLYPYNKDHICFQCPMFYPEPRSFYPT